MGVFGLRPLLRFEILFIAMLVLQERWFFVWKFSGATNAWQESYQVDGYLERVL